MVDIPAVDKYGIVPLDKKGSIGNNSGAGIGPENVKVVRVPAAGSNRLRYCHQLHDDIMSLKLEIRRVDELGCGNEVKTGGRGGQSRTGFCLAPCMSSFEADVKEDRELSFGACRQGMASTDIHLSKAAAEAQGLVLVAPDRITNRVWIDGDRLAGTNKSSIKMSGQGPLHAWALEDYKERWWKDCGWNWSDGVRQWWKPPGAWGAGAQQEAWFKVRKASDTLLMYLKVCVKLIGDKKASFQRRHPTGMSYDSW